MDPTNSFLVKLIWLQLKEAIPQKTSFLLGIAQIASLPPAPSFSFSRRESVLFALLKLSENNFDSRNWLWVIWGIFVTCHLGYLWWWNWPPKLMIAGGSPPIWALPKRKGIFWDGFPYLQKRGNPDCRKILFWFIVLFQMAFEAIE